MRFPTPAASGYQRTASAGGNGGCLYQICFLQSQTPPQSGKAYRIRGHREPFYTLNIIHGLLSAVCTAKNAAPAPESVAEEADEESSDSAAAASEPTDEAMFPIRPIRPVHPTSLLPRPLRFSRRSISHLLFSLPFGRLFHGRTLVPPYILKSHLADSPASGGETLRPTACESALAVNLGTNTRKT